MNDLDKVATDGKLDFLWQRLFDLQQLLISTQVITPKELEEMTKKRFEERHSK